MAKLEALKPGMPLVGLEPSVVATVAAVVPIGEGSVQVFFNSVIERHHFQTAVWRKQGPH